MILFPDINTLFTVNLDCHIRTHRRADRAAVAFLFFIDGHGTVSLGVELRGGHDMTLGAEMDAQVAFLAQVFFDFYIAFHRRIPICFVRGSTGAADAFLRKIYIMSSNFRKICRFWFKFC